jgi:mycothiol synthase
MNSGRMPRDPGDGSRSPAVLAGPGAGQVVSGVPIAAPSGLPGLRFRTCRGTEDYPAMVDVVNASYRADGVEEVVTPGQHAAEYDHPVGYDPQADVLVAEVDGDSSRGPRMIAYTRCSWEHQSDGTWTYDTRGYVAPGDRRSGLGRAMLRWGEERLRTIAADHPADGPRLFESWAMGEEAGAQALLQSEGYAPARYFFEMVRPTLGGLPEPDPLSGIELRTGDPARLDPVFLAENEAFRDHWGHREETRTDWDRFLSIPDVDPRLWVVAWDGDQVAGSSLNVVYAADNEAFGRRRVWIDALSVRRPWRRQGLGKALLVESLRVAREHGMTSAGLGVDAENPTGALGLYEQVGFAVARRSTVFRKPMSLPGAEGD